MSMLPPKELHTQCPQCRARMPGSVHEIRVPAPVAGRRGDDQRAPHRNVRKLERGA
jgi:hypothetical protein